jgi:CBS domain-containing protein
MGSAFPLQGGCQTSKENPMSIGRICQRDVDVADENESAQCAAERMRQRTAGALVVVNGQKQTIGILTDRDLAIRVVAEGLDAATTTVAEIMTKQPKTASEETPIESALSLMRSGGFRRLPVVNKSGELVGLVTLDDILMLLAEELRDAGALIERETPRAAAARLP